MGKVTVQYYTTVNPITMIGEESGICYGTDTSDASKNFKRGIENLKSGHMRTAEFPQVYLTIEGYSARFMRELYTHIGGAPTRLQASTRYINYGDFEYIEPASIESNSEAHEIYEDTMDTIRLGFAKLQELGVPKEDIANVLPLGMESKMVFRTNLRHLIEMCRQRMCSRAYWEYRQFMEDLCKALSEYSPEWEWLVKNYFKCKCDVSGYCEEKFSCGRKPKR